MFLKKLKGNILGIDIGSGNIHLALIKHGGKEEIISLENISVPKDSVVNGEIIDTIAIGAEIKKYIIVNNLKVKSVAFSISSPQVIIRDFSIPQTKKKYVESAIIEEISKIYRGVTESYSISYKITSSTKSNIKGIVALCPKNIVEEYVKLGYEIGEDLKYIDVNMNCTAKALKTFTKYDDTVGNIVVVDIGLKKSIVNIISNGKLVISRQLPSGVMELDELVSKEFNISIEEAEKSKRKGYTGMLNEASMQIYIRNAYSAIEREIGNTLNFFIQNISKKSISSMILIGGGSKVPGLNNYFQEVFNIPTVTLRETDLKKKLRSDEDISMFIPAIGAALRED